MSELTSCAVVSPAVGLAPQVRPLLQSSRGRPAAGFVEGLMQAAVEHRAVCHPYLRALADGELPDVSFALADFARQYPLYAKWFPHYLSVVAAKLSNAEHREPLLANLREECGFLDDEALGQLAAEGIAAGWVEGIPHAQLFERFNAALGVAPLFEGDQDARAALHWRDRFYSYLRDASPAAAVGAIGLGTEAIVRHIYPPIVAAIRQYARLEREDYVFFELHCLVDDAHSQTLLAIAESLARDERSRADLQRGMLAALELRAGFWDHLCLRAFARPRG
jgi:pyrroloquinoline quinone (PQQ) biosynthesis protein C